MADDSTNSTGIKSKAGPIPDAAFENDAAAALGDPQFNAEGKKAFDEKTARLISERAARLGRST